MRELRSDEWAAIPRLLRRLTGAIDALFESDQYNYAFLMNVDARVHLHVVPRYLSPHVQGPHVPGPQPRRVVGWQGAGAPADELRALAEATRSRL